MDVRDTLLYIEGMKNLADTVAAISERVLLVDRMIREITELTEKLNETEVRVNIGGGV